MRLLNVDTLQLETFYGANVPKYTALSHVWGDQEVTFEDLTTDVSRTKTGWTKLLGAATQAKRYHCKYVWIDSCCIDKTSSAELSEAINSMYLWYRCSELCVAYLEDVHGKPKHEIPDTVNVLDGTSKEAPDKTLPAGAPLAFSYQDFSKSRWFTRGWTLQELIAPRTVYFYDSSWNEIGDKGQLAEEISTITGIDADVLNDGEKLHYKSIARRMSWASYRNTTRPEDVAYCLLGIFAVNMPLLYGEGEKSFLRLQEEIMRLHYDHSLFMWNLDIPDTVSGSDAKLVKDTPIGLGLLAPHPIAFVDSVEIVPKSSRTKPYGLTNKGLRLHLRIISQDIPERTKLAVLQCGTKNSIGTAMAIPIVEISKTLGADQNGEFCRLPNRRPIEIDHSQIAHTLNQDVYFLGAGILRKSMDACPVHHCWLREYGQKAGIRFFGTQLLDFATGQVSTNNATYSWSNESRSMTWRRDSSGLRATLLFFKENGPVFTVLLTFKHGSSQNGRVITDCFSKPILDFTSESETEASRDRHFRSILLEESTLEHTLQSNRRQETITFEGRTLLVRLTSERIFDDEMFVLDLLLR